MAENNFWTGKRRLPFIITNLELYIIKEIKK
jgi:hypothetical protein